MGYDYRPYTLAVGVGGLLVIAFVVPMAQYHAYVSRK